MTYRAIVFTSNASFTVPEDWPVKSSIIHIYGGGAGGEVRVSDTRGGNGGGGGGYSRASNILLPGSTVSIVVGAGGSSNANGAPSSVTVNGVTYTANGGIVAGLGGVGNFNDGGRGGNGGNNISSAVLSGGGGGGAGGPRGDGVAGGATTDSGATPGSGGNADDFDSFDADNSLGGTPSTISANTAAGDNGRNVFDYGAGAGGAGGSSVSGTESHLVGRGGLFGGGGGGSGRSTLSGGAGGNGGVIIVLDYDTIIKDPWKYIVITDTSASGRFTIPSDWNSSNNFIHLIGGGSNGGRVTTIRAGGGGGGYTRANNYVATPGTIVSYRVGSPRVDTTFGALTAGAGGTGISFSPGGIGDTANGGRGANTTNDTGALGGGGAGGPFGAGANGSSTFGGAGGGGFGGLGGNTTIVVGSTGTEILPGLVGSGGGGYNDSRGGLFGGGGGFNVAANTPGPGAQGVIVIQYSPQTGYKTYDSTYGTVDLNDILLSSEELLNSYVNSKCFVAGYNATGELGINSTTSRSSPVQQGSFTNWAEVAAGWRSTLAVKQDGSLWGWGDNDHGELGIGNITNQSSPVQIGSAYYWKTVSISSFFDTAAFAIRNDGTLWAWGYNNRGSLGLGDLTHRSSPVQIGSLNNWSYVEAGYGGFTLAIKTDGTLWAWGTGTEGGLGLGSLTHRSSPVQVGSLNDWKSIATGATHAVATKTDGTLWVWGQNTYGKLGLGDLDHRSSPVQVGSLEEWNLPLAGWSYSAATNLNGSIWAWGFNGDGITGRSSTADVSSPVQVGSLYDWKYVTAGVGHMIGIKHNGTAWGWGENSQYGQLGLGDRVSRSSPTQIGTLTNWSKAYAGFATTFLISKDLES